MAKHVMCFYHVFGMQDCGPGLKNSGIGNCKTCHPSEENRDCKLFFEICVEDVLEEVSLSK